MSEQQAPSPDTPDFDATASAVDVGDSPDAGTAPDQTAVDWEKRAKDNQAWATRLAQQNSEYEQRLAPLSDFERFVAHGVEQGWLDGADGGSDSLLADDPSTQKVAQLEAQLAELKEWKQGLTAEQQQQEGYARYREEADQKLEQMGVDKAFIEQTANIAAEHLPPIQTPTGPQPDLEGAVQEVARIAEQFAQHPKTIEAVLRNYKASKQAPHIGQAGTAGKPALPIDADHATRTAWMNQALLDNE